MEILNKSPKQRNKWYTGKEGRRNKGQMGLSDYEYNNRKKKTKREEFLEIMDEIIPWDEWAGVVLPFYYKGQRGRPPKGVEVMLRMYLLHFRYLLDENSLNKLFFDVINWVMAASGHMMKGGTIVDATIIDAPSSTKNAEKKRDSEMHQTKEADNGALE